MSAYAVDDGARLVLIDPIAVPDDVRALAEARAAARKARNWSEADRLRAALHDAGWEMEDRADGYTLKRAAPR